MKIIKATYKIITPMFLGDANQKSSTLRPTSIKGALRFWWRALKWSNCLKNANNDEIKALKDLNHQERIIFGSSEDGAGQGVFLLKVVDVSCEEILTNNIDKASAGHAYLLGQGVYDTRSQSYQRNAIKAGSEFRVEACFKPNVNPDHVKDVELTLLTFGLLGGLGSRARKGFGSVAIQSFEFKNLTKNYDVPTTVDEYKTFLNTHIFYKLTDKLPPFSAFSQYSRCDIYGHKKVDQKSWSLLNDIGSKMQKYRSFGRNGLVNGDTAERNFTNDHDLVRNFIQTGRASEHPDRIVFGMPHAYFFTSLPNHNNKADVIPSGAKIERRTSPLVIHLHELGNQVFAIQALFKSQYLPEGVQIKLKSRGNDKIVSQQIDWQVIDKYLDRFKANSEIIFAGK